MSKHLRSVGMLLFLASMCGGVANALPAEGVAGIQIIQQNGTANGVVKDALGETVIGASVVVKGTTNGTITDFDGNFSLSDVKKGDIIVVSFVGYQTQEVAWNGQALNITLKDDTQALEEVVVVGYGSQKKVNLTGSVSQVKGEVLESRPVANAAQALQGVVPGLNLSVGTGGGEMNQAMSMNIRGTGSIGSGSSAAPLVLIDGIEGDLGTVNPQDIESISVLKDAASASIYGARGSFGVILITTKSGKSGKTNVSYSGNVRFNTAIALPDMVDSYTFAQYWNAASINAGSGQAFTDEQVQRIKDYQAGKLPYGTDDFNGDGRWDNYAAGFANTDWFKEFYNSNVPTHEHNISISGGSEKIQFMLSGNYLDQKGLLAHGDDNFNRYTTNAKINAQLTDWAKVDYNFKWTRSDYDRPTYLQSNGGGLFFHNIARRWPTCAVYDPNGNYMAEMEIVELERGGTTQDQKDWFTQQLQFVFEPIKDWRITVNGSMQTYNYLQHRHILPVEGYDVNNNPYYTANGDYGAGQSYVYEYRMKQDYFTVNAFTDYSKQLGDHWFKAMAGFNAELTRKNEMNGSGYSLNSLNVPFLNQTTANKATSASVAENSLAGFFGRINYNYKEKYLLEFNLRYDGASRFVGENQWGLFPSVSAGWNLANEDFFKDWNWGGDNISTLKVRGSWGQLGNNRTNSWYPFYQTLSTGVENSNWLLNGNKQNTASMAGIVSSVLTWETVETLDFGFDLNAFNNRFNLTFDWFTRWTYDMVGPAPTLPSILGASAPAVNNCDMKSVGWELEASWRDQIGAVRYGAKLVLSDSKAEILKYPNETKSLSSYYDGMEVGEIWGYETKGIAQSDQEIADWIAAGNKPSWGSNWTAGDIMYKDLNGDGIINTGANTLADSGDRVKLGNTTARYNYGVTLDAAWNGFDLSMFWQGVLKRDWYFGAGDAYFWGAQGNKWQSCAFEEHMDYWTPENTDAYYPKPYLTNGITKNQQVQSRYIQDASYLRLKNIQLGYTLPASWTSKAGISKVRIYFSADNMLTFSSMAKQFDPEGLSGYWGSGKTYPIQKSFSFGLNLNF